MSPMTVIDGSTMNVIKPFFLGGEQIIILIFYDGSELRILKVRQTKNKYRFEIAQLACCYDRKGARMASRALSLCRLEQRTPRLGDSSSAREVATLSPDD